MFCHSIRLMGSLSAIPAATGSLLHNWEVHKQFEDNNNDGSITAWDGGEVEILNDESTLGVDDNILASSTTSDNNEVENKVDDISTSSIDCTQSQQLDISNNVETK
ncbi:unnamed protein product [Lepeophtheirus salmonis]|uniref:(salmon louse) hypothetical protein n=1 Tax=Lepeophtheirus salmonis TaxID=72036 RepID=A0A7R8CNR2_LEPSM|nr:unnamed protein product [Lepeophtheirus salmonis]CAF2832085.1 unnamed protein product [Lepeophtheirus salmonis]